MAGQVSAPGAGPSVPSPSFERTSPPTSPSHGGGPKPDRPGRTDRALFIPLARLFGPEADPTEKYPDQVAEVGGYVANADHAVTFAVTSPSTGGIDLLDSVWGALRRKGLGVRNLTVLNDRGQVVSLMTVTLVAPEETIRLLRSLVVVPVRAQDGYAELHVLASPAEAQAVEETIPRETTGGPSDVQLPPARQAGRLQPEDWAFLGLLSVVGALDGPEVMPPGVLAEALGVEPAVFAERARAIERGLQGVVEGLFGAPAPTGVGAVA